MEPAELFTALADDPAVAGVGVLALHGSRARGDAAAGSDWDLAYLADDHDGTPSPDPVALLVALTRVLGTDDVDLATASALLRFRVSRDGMLLHEARPEAFLDFRLEAVRFWCDAGPVIRAAQADVLASLG